MVFSTQEYSWSEFTTQSDKLQKSFNPSFKYADDTCVIGLVGNDLDLCNYFSEINRISKQCMDLDLLLNASKTKEMLFSTQRLKPDSP